MHLSTLPLNQVPNKVKPTRPRCKHFQQCQKIEVGIIFANELLDNLPFDIFESQNDGSWLEVKITVDDENISETLIPNNEKAPPYTLETPNVRVPVQREAQSGFKTLQKFYIMDRSS